MAGDTWRYQWQAIHDTYLYVRQLGKDPASATAAFHEQMKRCHLGFEKSPFTGDHRGAEKTVAARARQEAAWLYCGRPYYKITSGCYDALLRTSLAHCKMSDVRLPFPVVEVRFPGTHWNNSPVMLIAGFDAPARDGVVVAGLQIFYQTVAHLTQLGSGITGHCRLMCAWDGANGPTFGDAEEALDERGETKNHIHVAVGVILLATHAHDELFSPVLLRRDEDRWEYAPEDQRTRMVDRAQRLHKSKGWIVGHDLRCPTIRKEHGDNGTPTGRHLTHQHWRAGHFHRVRHGEGHALSKLQWFRPTLIRPDLPCAPKTGRRYRVDVAMPVAVVAGEEN